MAIVGCGEARTASVAKSIESVPIDPGRLVSHYLNKDGVSSSQITEFTTHASFGL